MSNEAMSDIRALKRELLAKLAEVDEQEARLKESHDHRRHNALYTLTAVAMSRIRELGLSVVSVNEGASLSPELLDADLSPRPGRGEVAVQMSSARERKGYVDHSDQVDEYEGCPRMQEYGPEWR